MSSNWKFAWGLVAGALVVGFVLLLSPGRSPGALADKDGGPRYTVVATDGTHLVVTDNQESKVHFYAIERDGKPGDDLKLRGSINLNDVGKPSIKPVHPK